MNQAEWNVSTGPRAMLRHLLREEEVLGTDTGGATVSRVTTRTTPLASDRKLRLFACACACAWLPWPESLPDRERVRRVIAAAERLADDPTWLADPDDYEAASQDAHEAGTHALIKSNGEHAARAWCNFGGLGAATQRDMTAILRCIVGDPFQPAKLRRLNASPDMLDQCLSLARGAYEERNADDGTLDNFRLALLADSLEEAGMIGEACGECPKLEKARVDARGYYDRDMTREVIEWGKRKKACRCGGSGRMPSLVLEHLRSLGSHWRGCWAVDLILGKS